MKKLEVRSLWIDWIADRVQQGKLRVKIFDILSDEILVESGVPEGVPQGSPLSSLLLLCFINNIKGFFRSCAFLLFADDLIIFRTIRNLEDCKLLQQDLDWCIENEMSLNVAKCQIMRLHRLQVPIVFDYKIKNDILESVTLVKDLGIYFD